MKSFEGPPGKTKNTLESEARFRQTKETLEDSVSEINEFFKQETLDERDRVRLTRVLQLVARYKPERETEQKKANKWLRYLESAYRLLPSHKPNRKEKDQKPVDNLSPQAYLLAEKTVALLRDLRHIDTRLEQEGGFSEAEVLNQELSGEIKRQETLDTSITLDYEKKNWGVERICLDGIQNHLPADSKGEQVWVRCLVDSEWVSLAEAREKKDKIKAVRFTDDGVGFDVKNLVLLYSTKAGEKESTGQFGEGLKMMAAAALREGLEPEMESQNWRAKPISKEVKISDTRHHTEKTVQQLSFQVDHLDDKPMIGSRTTFRKPTKEFIDELMQIENKVLPLDKNYRPIFVGSAGEIVSREPGGLFVKGVYVSNQETLLSYNFDDVETNRDRNTVTHNVDDKIRSIIEEISDKRLVKTMLQKSILDSDTIENSFYNLTVEHPGVWVDGFYEAFGKDAILDTGFEIPGIFKDDSLKKIKLPSTMSSLLMRAGVKTDGEVTPDFWEETIPTSLTLEYGKDIWNEERILLDAVQNHLPQDSGGSKIGLRFKTKDETWHSFNDLPDVKDEEIDSVKIYDDGRGYDSRLLGFLYSTKGSSKSAGKFGEGLKMLCSASLRKGIDITLCSQDWSSRPRASRQEIEDRQIDQLVFDVTHAVKEKTMDDGDNIYQSSSTTFSNPTPELLQEFRQINKKVLSIEKPRPIEKTEYGDILSLDGGMVYVREILIPGDHNLLFTYHFPELEVKNRDRSLVAEEILIPPISGVWSETENPEAIKTFLFKANLAVRQGGDKDKLEFSMNFTPKKPDNWKKVFTEIFGEDVAIRDVQSEDYDAMHQNQHIGLELISFPSSVYQVLSRLGLPTYESRISEMTDVEHIPDEELTAEEKGLISSLMEIDEYLPNNMPSEIKIYKRKYTGQNVAWGMSDGAYVHLLRDILTDFTLAANVYIHEKAHHNTGGAKDASSGFRNYLTLALAQMSLDKLTSPK